MMADDNQSSPSSAAEDKAKPLAVEEAKEGEVIASKTPSIEDETTKLQEQHNHLCNGFAKANDTSEKITNSNDSHEHKEEVKHEGSAVQAAPKTTVSEHENNNNNNCEDSLEVDNNNEVYVEEKTYTSETSLIVKQVTEEVVKEDDHVPTETMHNEFVSDETVTKVPDEGDGQSEISASAEKETASLISLEAAPHEKDDNILTPAKVEEKIHTEVSETHTEITNTHTEITEKVVEKHAEVVETHTEIVESHSETIVTNVENSNHHDEDAHHEVTLETSTTFGSAAAPMKPLEIPTPTDEEGDGFVPLAECLPHDDETEDAHDLENNSTEKSTEEHKIETNGYGDHVMPSSTTSTPEPTLDENKASHPEMEQFLKSGGVKRILPGVQKTEQPYSSCTTETKIAMEIREMREREEELRIMREQAVLSPVVSPVPPKSPVGRSPSPSLKDGASPTPAGPGYRVSSVFGHRGTNSPSPSPPIIPEEERKPFKASKESAVEKEIRMARDREEELRKQKGLPPREDDSYVKPSQVKSSQVRIFGKAVHSASVKQAATAKIQMEIEEQTQREMALRDTGSIQTISQERTDAKVAKLATENTPPPTYTNGNSQPHLNGNHTNGRHSPDVAPYKRSSPSPTGLAGRPASIFSQTNGKSNISMQKFIASKGKETTFTAPKNGNGGPFVVTKEERSAVVPPTMVKLKRTVSVESKIQQEIMEMKQREEELKRLHMIKSAEESNGHDENGRDHEMNQKNNLMEYENGINEEDISPRHNKLIAQWEQRIQKAES